VLYIIYVI